MNYNSVQLKDLDGNPLMPVTTSNHVYTSSGEPLESVLDSVTYTAGYGIKIENGVISCTFVDGTEEDY